MKACALLLFLIVVSSARCAHALRPTSVATLHKKLATFVPIASDHGHLSEGLWTVLGLKRAHVRPSDLTQLPYRYLLSSLKGKQVRIRGGNSGEVLEPFIRRGVPWLSVKTWDGVETVRLSQVERPDEPLGQDVHLSHDQVIDPPVLSKVLLLGLKNDQVIFFAWPQLRSIVAETIAARLGQGDARLRNLSLQFRTWDGARGELPVPLQETSEMLSTDPHGVWFTGILGNTPLVRHAIYTYVGFDPKELERGRRAIKAFDAWVGPPAAPSDVQLGDVKADISEKRPDDYDHFK